MPVPQQWVCNQNEQLFFNTQTIVLKIFVQKGAANVSLTLSLYQCVSLSWVRNLGFPCGADVQIGPTCQSESNSFNHNGAATVGV